MNYVEILFQINSELFKDVGTAMTAARIAVNVTSLFNK